VLQYAYLGIRFLASIRWSLLGSAVSIGSMRRLSYATLGYSAAKSVTGQLCSAASLLLEA